MVSCEVAPFGSFVPQIAVVSEEVLVYLPPPSRSTLCPLSLLLVEQSVKGFSQFQHCISIPSNMLIEFTDTLSL